MLIFINIQYPLNLASLTKPNHYFSSSPRRKIGVKAALKHPKTPSHPTATKVFPSRSPASPLLLPNCHTPPPPQQHPEQPLTSHRYQFRSNIRIYTNQARTAYLLYISSVSFSPHQHYLPRCCVRGRNHKEFVFKPGGGLVSAREVGGWGFLSAFPDESRLCLVLTLVSRMECNRE